MELAGLLELLYTARTRYSSVRAVVRAWGHSERAMRAFRKRAHDGAAVVYTAPARPPVPETSESTARIWALADLSRWRVEQSARQGGEPVEILTVRDRDWSWTWTSYGGAFSNQGQANSSHALPIRTWLLDPSVLLATEQLEVVAEATVARRAAIKVRSEPRSGRDRLHFGAPPEGDFHELYVDLERGLVLRDIGYVDGEPFADTEVSEVVFDEQFDDEVFHFEPPDGEAVKTPEELFALPEETTIDAAAREAPFTVLVPGRIPEDTEMRVTLIPSRPRLQPTSVHISYRRRDGRAWVSISEQGEPDHLLWGEHWETLETDGTTLFARTMSEQEQLGLEREGTWVTLVGTGLRRDDLVEIALSLRPAPTDPPRLADA